MLDRTTACCDLVRSSSFCFRAWRVLLTCSRPSGGKSSSVTICRCLPCLGAGLCDVSWGAVVLTRRAHTNTVNPNQGWVVLGRMSFLLCKLLHICVNSVYCVQLFDKKS